MKKEDIIKEKISELTILIKTAREEGSKEEHEKVVNSIMELFKAQREEIIEEIERECRKHIACNKLGDTSRGEWVIGFHQGLHWVRGLLINKLK